MSVRGRGKALGAAVAAEAANESWAPVVECPAWLRGVSTLTASGLACEIGEWRHSEGTRSAPNSGLCPARVPSLSVATGGDAQHGHRPRRPVACGDRLAPTQPTAGERRTGALREGQPTLVREVAAAAERRVHRRWRSFDHGASAPQRPPPTPRHWSWQTQPIT